MGRRVVLAAIVALALTAAPAAAGSHNGHVRMKPRSCEPRHTRVVEREQGVVFSLGREVWYGCAVWIGRGYNLFGPVYKELFAPTDGGCDLGTNVVTGPVRGETVRYRLSCNYS